MMMVIHDVGDDVWCVAMMVMICAVMMMVIVCSNDRGDDDM